MIGLIQRVSQASVEVSGDTIGRIGPGLMVLVGVEREDGGAQVEGLAHKLLHYRVFSDSAGKMNCNVMEQHGELLLVPQFTLAADTRKGLRPSFNGASPDVASDLFDGLVEMIASRYKRPMTGQFGADMSVSLCNEGPVTFWLQVSQASKV